MIECDALGRGQKGKLVKRVKEVKATVIITVYNQKKALLYCLKWLRKIPEVANIIIVDNGSEDGLVEMLPELGCDYIYFDEGMQGYAKAWNAALMNFDTEEIIVFMQPQYLPGKKCLFRLAETLEKENCGIAGPMCNNGGISTQNVKIDSVNHLHELEDMSVEEEAETFWCLSLESGIWALSKDVWKETGAFDERLERSRNVFLDYKLRLIQSGRLPMGCRQAFAYDLSQGELILLQEFSMGNSDKNILEKKWDMNYFNLTPAGGIVNLISEEQDAPIRVLEVGCDLGSTLVEIKNRYPNSQVCGLEINEASAAIACHMVDVQIGNIEDKVIPFEEKFDYIIFADVLEHLRNPEDVVKYCRDRLKDNGCILASIPNVMHVSVMEQMLNGRFTYNNVGLLDRTHIHLFTIYEIMRMFQEAGYKVEKTDVTAIPLSETQQELVEKLMQISSGDVTREMYYAYQYMTRARKCEV